MQKIGLFCSASDSIDKIYFDGAKEFGTWIGRSNKTLIYGGASLGLMESIAQAVKANGGTPIGIVPSKLEEDGKVSLLLDKIVKTHDLSDRKDIILREADVLVAFPGGIGTFDEIFHVMAAASIGYHTKKVILYNLNGFYDGLLRILNHLNETHFIQHPLECYFKTANTFNELIDLLIDSE